MKVTLKETGMFYFLMVWADFRLRYWARLDEDQKRSYELDFEDGLLPPSQESLSSLDVYEE